MLLLQTTCALGLWGFPKGKIDDNEDRGQCAIREVYEETGYSISPFINDNLYVAGTWNNSTENGFTGLYIIPNVPMETKFKAKTKTEIKKFKWFQLNDLFNAKNGLYADTTIRLTANAFYMKEYFQKFLMTNPTLNSNKLNHFNGTKFNTGGGFDTNRYQQRNHHEQQQQQDRNQQQNQCDQQNHYQQRKHYQQQQQDRYQQQNQYEQRNHYQQRNHHQQQQPPYRYQQRNQYEQRNQYQQRNHYQQQQQQDRHQQRNRYIVLRRSIFK